MVKKIEKFLKSTTDLLDKKLKNGTVMVLIIANLITAIWFLSNTANANLTANVIESQKNTIQAEQYIIIDGKKFKILLEEVK